MPNQRVAITGTTGQLGRALLESSPAHWDVVPISRSDADIVNLRQISSCLRESSPDIIIHAAAATDVDGCERDPDFAFQVNTLGTRNVVSAAADIGAKVVYISTNFVFDGRREEPYHEFDQPNPISVYGASKLAGERETQAAVSNCYIVRTAMLYARDGNNFVNTMRRLMQERESLSVVSDQYGNPSYASDVAEAIVKLIEQGPGGIHHVVNSGTASWYEWALEIAAIDKSACDISPIPATEYLRDAEPPANGSLTSLSLSGLGIDMPRWRDALRRCLTV